MNLDAAQFLRPIAPRDLDGVPLYVDDVVDLPVELRFTGSHAAAIHAPWLDLALRYHHESNGTWQGRGVQIIYDRAGIMAELLADCGGDAEFAAEMFDDRLRAILAHELGHAMDNGLCLDDAPAVRVERSHQRLAAYCAAPPPCAPVPWAGHDWRWIRATLHLVWRAEELGVHVPLGIACNTASYSLSPPFAYQSLLGTEPETFADASFANINKFPPPAAFTKLFKADVAVWQAQQQVRAAIAGR